MKPLFITFEGPDKAGKTTQIALFCQALRDRGVDFIQTREPGSGTSETLLLGLFFLL